MQTLSSYLCGAWQTGQGTPQTLENAVNGQAVAEVSSQGLDLAAAVSYAREVGGPALRAMTFAERGQALKALSAAIYEVREELIDLAALNGGCTRGDAKFDIDGATGTLAAYAHFAKSMGDKSYLLDGEGLQLGRTARFWGQHVRVPRRGVAVHINAFNFPAWGMMEKAACALLAGVPVIEKPATATALVAWRIAQVVVQAGILPEGAFQFLCGSAGDLLDHLGAQDCVAFTGSARTGEVIRGNANLVKHNVRVNIEADSINAAVLAPDVDESSETYGLFLSNVVTDMTQKSGQKCTAVRRIFVPEERAEQVAQDLAQELGRIKVGDPNDRENRMGPVAHSGQRKDVASGLARLAEVAKPITGGLADHPLGGCYVAPTLFLASDGNAQVLHELEVFGPVATVIPYAGSAQSAADGVVRGGGGLVTSVYSNDAAWTEHYVLEVAPWHGRVWIGSDRMAEQSLAPGMVLPGLIHGGPGRAGGGEELGAARGLEFYTQRVALQGFQGFLQGHFGA
ncbi:MAG: 3,4-dehydroadipyl-CoA semialdehyde dehydrogenase [Planctomycetes bacterium]|nr:3,4-dehydroadipyl-CoA semialdehyde dehydrogenase [Planctomycetota bacterium]MCB9910612.1 3,4-dehydroadipyl-CoA semialdehyde dehydrogenase [Planctomycetota bacterium]HPF13002.1 3,4-dehydroadipyl-CoA semialdehyde dehydrogenase [Planctomycetota bacterium]